MSNFEIEQSQTEITNIAGLSIVGKQLLNYTNLRNDVDKRCPVRHGTPTSDIVFSYIGLLAQGKSDFIAIENYRQDHFFKEALDLLNVPSDSSLRSRLEACPCNMNISVQNSVVEYLNKANVEITPLYTGHVALDGDSTPFDNSNTKKQGVSWTYKKYFGLHPQAMYIGVQGWCLEMILRPGSDHCQKDFPEFMVRNIIRAQKLTDLPLLMRLDSGYYSFENITLLSQMPDVDFIISVNNKRTKLDKIIKLAEKNVSWEEYNSKQDRLHYKHSFSIKWGDQTIETNRIIRITKTHTDKYCNMLLTPDYKVEMWMSSLDLDAKEIISLYNDHGTSEQFHSEFKTDLDIERLPSGVFEVNAVILTMATLVYNMLRHIGLLGLVNNKKINRHPVKRKRIKTVMQEIIYSAAKFVRTGRRIKLSLGKSYKLFAVFKFLYNHFCTP